uniref:roquin-1-like isoform X1 n=1 Tax=Styela clava TaxID=7725 RepID=UPI0019396137|nr:roquin-1-like isoform X1 [Styela clava]
MPLHPFQWTDFLTCANCNKEFSIEPKRFPITLLCSHSICQECVGQVQVKGCPQELNSSPPDLSTLGVNFALLQLVIYQNNLGRSASYRPKDPEKLLSKLGADYSSYTKCCHLVEGLAIHLQDIKNGILPNESDLTKPMLRKLVTLVQSQLALEEGRLKMLRSCRAIGERASTELILAHQNPATLSGNLWTAVRARGCQFLGPAMQEEALKLILLALEDGSELSRKVLVMFVVQKLQQQFSQASKTSIGHVVQLLYRASCFVVKKRDGDSSLMKLKEIYRTYPALRREHDAQVVQIAREAGLRIAPDQWSALLYGDQGHKSHMQSVIDRLQSGESLQRCIQDLDNAIKSSDSTNLKSLIPHFEILAKISAESTLSPQDLHNNDWNFLISCLQSVNFIIKELIIFSKSHKPHDLWHDEESPSQTAKFKTSFCRDIKSKGRCPRGSSCTFAHSEEELHHHRNKRKKASLGYPARDKRQPNAASPASNADVQQRILDVDHRQAGIRATPPIAPVQPRQGEPVPGNHVYSYPQQSGYQQHLPVQQPPMMQQRPISPQMHVPIAPQHFRPPPSYYGYDPYRQQQHAGVEGNYNQTYNQYSYGPPPNQQYSHIPTGKPIPIENSMPQHLQPRNEQPPVKSGNMYEQNLPHFTVTLSFQSKPNADPMSASQQVVVAQQQQMGRPSSVNVSQSMTENMTLSRPVDTFTSQSIPSRQQDTMTRTQFMRQRAMATPGIINNRLVDPSPPPYPMQTNTVPKNMGSSGFYPIQPQHAPTNEPIDRSQMYRVQSPVYQSSPMQVRDPRVAVVAPQQIIQQPPPSATPTHIYDPGMNMVFSNNFQQQEVIAQTVPCPSPFMMTQSPVNQPSNTPVLIPVVPVTQYQVIDQQMVHVPSQMIPVTLPYVPTVVHFEDITYAREKQISLCDDIASELSIPKSIDDATVAQLERRKEQILDKLLHNQSQQKDDVCPPPDVMPSTDAERFYDVWNCQSYSPLFNLQTAVTVLPENLQCEDYSSNVVDVIAEIDTRTKQVTMRGTDIINPSHARNERTLDDTKMHRLMLEKNDDMKNAESSSESSQPLKALIYYSSGPPDKEGHAVVVNNDDDEMIPFSDRPTVSKYGPIARSVRTRPSNTDSVQVNANADVSTHSVAASNDVPNQKQSAAIKRSVYSSFENMHAVSYFPASYPRSRESFSTQNLKNHPCIPAAATGAVPSRCISITQAASNSKLLHREETALQQNKPPNPTEDLQLAMELQQIELGIHQKKQQHYQ